MDILESASQVFGILSFFVAVISLFKNFQQKNTIKKLKQTITKMNNNQSVSGNSNNVAGGNINIKSNNND